MTLCRLIVTMIITIILSETAETKKNQKDNLPSPTRDTTKGDLVVEKFVETLMSSERYLKMVESVEKKLNHLDATFHEKTNSIMKYLSEMLRMGKTSSAEGLELSLKSLKTDLDKLKGYVSEQAEKQGPSMRVEGREYNVEGTVDTRLSYIEGNVKNIMSGVDSIMNTISEVKNRQYARTSNKLDSAGAVDTITLLSEFRRNLYEQKMKRCDCKQGRVDRAERYPTDCHEIQMQGFNVSGIYKIKPEDMEPFYVLCDLTTAGGGWTVFQNRFDGSHDFYRNWNDYKHGFGNLAGEFWLGLEQLHYLTNQKLYELRIDIEAQQGMEAYAMYSVFTVGPEHEGYRISTLGTFRGTAGDSLTYHAGQKFSTYDVDRDEWKDGACAVEHGGAWWYKECDKSNLNGKYTNLPGPDEHRGKIIYWISFKGPNVPLTKTKMMIRPLPASRPSDFFETRKIALDSRLKEMRLADKKKAVFPAVKEAKHKGYDLTPKRPYYDEAPQINPFFNNY